MYLPGHFEESRREVLHAMMQAHPLGALVTYGEHGLDANHVPFELVPHSGEFGTLHAHVARANPVWKLLNGGEEVLVIFRADDAYISPNWYPGKQTNEKQVPTWNYRVVHARGRVVIHDEDAYVRALVARLTQQHESSQAVPWKMADAPTDYIDSMVRAIVGIEIDITHLIGKFKLSQNRPGADRIGAAEALIAQGDTALGQAMLDAGAVRAHP